MAVNDISLTSGMRNNLLSLQKTSDLINTTQNRLSTGKKVNSPLDNPTNYFAAQTHLERASDLTARKDGMAEAVQMVKAADAGIKAVTSLIESAKGVASSAAATSSATDRANYAATFNTLMTQISELASDSGYRGTNLLTNDNQTVEFGQKTGTATLGINGFNATAAGLTIDTASISSAASSGGTASTSITGTSVGGAALTAWNAIDGTGNVTSAATQAIQSASSQLEGALSALRTQSSKLSSNLSVVTTRQDFTSSMINTLQTGADNLTLADMNEEGANMLMLQTQQNLGVTSLSMASQAAQAVMRLF
ncbi:MAG: flagellin [Geobacteraceae bacterium]|nr:flagellin [Geobacteraceae bacterium]